MGVVSVLGAHTMSWASTNPVLEWLWRRLAAWWRCCGRMLIPVLGFSAVLLRLRWRQDPGDEPEAGGEGRGPVRGGSPEDAEAALGGVQPGGKRVAGFDQGVFSKRPKIEEEEEEEEEEFDSEEYRVQVTDELCCGYDSTWETEEDQGDTSGRTRGGAAASKYYKFSKFESAARDMQNYRHNYPTRSKRQPSRKQPPQDKPNLNFYLGVTATLPDGVFITQFHEEWHGEYDTLEYVHTYIQWLFPLQEPGMNYEASTLTEEEIEDFRNNRAAKENLLKSYKLMLDFYGIELCDEATGEVKRASNYGDRFRNLNSHTHNNLRITRILKCLGTLGYPHYQAPLVRFFLEETLVNGELPNVKDSVLNYFLFAVLDKRQRRDLIKFAYMNYDRKDEFVWCPKKIQRVWSGLAKPQTQMVDQQGPDLSSPLNYCSTESETQDKVKGAARASYNT